MFLFKSVERIPAWVAVRTWPVDLGADDVDDCCESRRSPGPSLKGADVVEGRWSDGTSSLGSNMRGVVMVGRPTARRQLSQLIG